MDYDEETKRHYLNDNVRIGNWAHARLENDFKKNNLKRDIARKDTMCHKVNQVFAAFLKSVQLPAGSIYVLYDQILQVRAPYLSTYLQQRGGTLSVTLSEEAVDLYPDVVEGLNLTVSTMEAPSARNAFQIVPLEPVPSGTVLNYWDKFMLITELSGGKKLYIEAEPSRVGNPLHPYNCPLVRLTAIPTHYCWWFAAPVKAPQVRDDVVNPRPVQAADKLVIRQAVTNEALYAEKELLYSTFFGKEYGVTAHNSHYSIEQIELGHAWQFISGLVSF